MLCNLRNSLVLWNKTKAFGCPPYSFLCALIWGWNARLFTLRAPSSKFQPFLDQFRDPLCLSALHCLSRRPSDPTSRPRRRGDCEPQSALVVNTSPGWRSGAAERRRENRGAVLDGIFWALTAKKACERCIKTRRGEA